MAWTWVLQKRDSAPRCCCSPGSELKGNGVSLTPLMIFHLPVSAKTNGQGELIHQLLREKKKKKLWWRVGGGGPQSRVA